jgi:ubiquinol-cytochrome c reductase iron-sulfur subunit|tara:strand:- start:936 stop:1493 length:558 start_codon:yes stop_codon:yes gene_type:complete
MRKVPNADDPRHATKESRRDFLYLTTGAVAAVGAAAAVWPLIDSMNPAADELAIAKIEIDLKPVELAQRITVKWQGKPIFIVHRTADQIAASRADDDNPGLIDPATDSARAQRAEWLVVIGICTHLGCIPKGQVAGDPVGEWGGWFCVCHGSVYDMAGRIRRGPAPKNLYLPPYEFLNDGLVRIG